MVEQDESNISERVESEINFDNMHLTPAEHFMMGSTPAFSSHEVLFTTEDIDRLLQEDPNIFFKPLSALKNPSEIAVAINARKRKQQVRNLYQAFQTQQVLQMFDDDICPILVLSAPNEDGLVEEAKFIFENSMGNNERFHLRSDLKKIFPFSVSTPEGERIFLRENLEGEDAS